MEKSERVDFATARLMLVRALQQVAAGEKTGLQAVYKLTSAKLFGICLRICGDRQGAEDVLQEVFITIWTRADRFDEDRASPITWLAAITRNRAIDWRRRQGRVTEAPVVSAELVADTSPSAWDILMDRDEAAQLKECLDTLDAHSASAIRSAFLDGKTYAELADGAKVPLGTMKSWIRRGLLRLKACLSHD